MLIDAAAMARLSVQQLVHENTAAAAFFGIDRLDTDKSLNVLFFNMGGRDTEVSVVKYSASSGSEAEATESIEQIEILGEAYDQTLGGCAFDSILVDIFAEKFNELPSRQGMADVRENERALVKLYKEATTIKEILSASKTARVNIPELLNSTDLTFELTRKEFEERAQMLFARIEAPILKALEEANLSFDQID